MMAIAIERKLDSLPVGGKYEYVRLRDADSEENLENIEIWSHPPESNRRPADYES
jgi:hypothetical protein